MSQYGTRVVIMIDSLNCYVLLRRIASSFFVDTVNIRVENTGM